MEIVSGQNGEVKFDIKIEKGIILLSVGYEGAGASSAVTVSLESEYFLDKLKASIPGTIDDSIIDLIKVAIKA